MKFEILHRKGQRIGKKRDTLCALNCLACLPSATQQHGNLLERRLEPREEISSAVEEQHTGHIIMSFFCLPLWLGKLNLNKISCCAKRRCLLLESC